MAPRETENNAYAKFWGDKQRALWYVTVFLEWSIQKQFPRGFLKVTLLEKGMKFSFVLIATIRYFKLSSKQIMSILRKFLSSSFHLIVKLD